jgi:hypothetical protein
MDCDDVIAVCAASSIDKQIELLLNEPQPLPYGVAMKYGSFVPRRSPQDILDRETSAYWFWYAASLAEYIKLLDSAEKMPFVRKSK